MGPGGGPPGLHRHAPEEVYRVDRGQLTVHLEDGRGEVLMVPFLADLDKLLVRFSLLE
jgi:hypothetical protein